jgi:hypothetical protein
MAKPSTDPDLFDHDELREYVDALKGSSDRGRHVLFAVLIVSLLLAVVNYNMVDYSWPRSRTREILAHGFEGRPRVGAPDREIREEIGRIYLEQFMEHAVSVTSPIPGVWIDFNDVGTAGGAILLLLMLALVYYLAREHENLYLSLFRVRSLCSDPGHERGDSRANLLYHALAMRQALSFPPTLARWRRGPLFKHLGIVFFLPFVVYVWVVWTTFRWAKEDPILGGGNVALMNRTLALQVLFALLMFALSLMAHLLSRSMAIRWRSAFFRVNPGRVLAPQSSAREWLSLRRTKMRIEERVRSELVDTLLHAPESFDEVDVHASLRLSQGPQIDLETRDRMVKELLRRADRKARDRCARERKRYLGIARFRVIDKANVATSAEWEVAAICRYSYEELDT